MPIVAQDRYHAFDAVRAFALLAGIVQHGSMSFVAVSSPVQDISQSWILSVTYYVIHIFRMGLFFMIAGFFARILLYRRGTRAFVQDRLMRIFVPMVVGWCIFGTLAIVILHWGIARTSGPSNSVPWGFTFLHFWFLYYLVIFTCWH
jgi:fucose 4-O-acetylase-like acetyltransferase